MNYTQFNEQLKKNSELFSNAFGKLSLEQLNTKPNPQTWSIAQNIEHLTTTNKSYYPIFEKLQSGNYLLPFTAKLGFVVSLFEKMILGSVEPERKKRMKTFPVWEPSSSNIEQPLQDFAQSQEEIAQRLQAIWPLVEKGAILSSPANRNIVYRLPVLLSIITNHQLRHFNQAKEVASMLP